MDLSFKKSWYPGLGVASLIISAAAAPLELLSGGLSPANQSTAASGSSGGGYITRNSLFVAFTSDADDLVPGDQNGPVLDIFVKDLWSNTVVLGSASLTRTNGGNRHSSVPMVSEDGRWVAFESEASDLVPGDTNGVSDIFLRDLTSNVTWKVSGPSQVAGASQRPQLSPDGRFVVFESDAILASGDTNTARDVYLFDRQTRASELISLGMSSLPNSNGLLRFECVRPQVTDNGRFVVFERRRDGAADQVVVRDRLAGTFFISNHPTNEAALSPRLSAEGQTLVYKVLNIDTNTPAVRYLRRDLESQVETQLYAGTRSTASLAAMDHLYGEDQSGPAINGSATRVVFVHNDTLWLWDTNQLRSLLTLPAGAVANHPQLSLSGRELLFQSSAALTSNSLPGVVQIYARNLATDETVLISRRINGEGSPYDAGGAMLAGAGDGVIFQSDDPAIAPRDLNQSVDIFFGDVAGFTVALVSSRTGPPSIPPAGLTMSLVPGSSPLLTWKAVPSYAYRVRFKDSILAPWQDLNTEVTVTFGKAKAFDRQPSTTGKRFYQIMVIP